MVAVFYNFTQERAEWIITEDSEGSIFRKSDLEVSFMGGVKNKSVQ
jgi:hypothetical protein